MIPWLENNIAQVEKFLASDRRRLERNPNSFSAKLTLASTESRLADLKKKLQSEKLKLIEATA